MTITPMTGVPAAHAQQLGLAPVETLNGKASLDGIINVWRAFIREGGDYRTATGIVTNGQGDFWVTVAPPQDNPTFNLWSFIMPKVAPHWAALANGGPRRARSGPTRIGQGQDHSRRRALGSGRPRSHDDSRAATQVTIQPCARAAAASCSPRTTEA